MGKEEDKIEKLIRGLLKLPENRRCINCNSLGPQYVCTSFWTFVCTSCSGVHREFTHRVKSVSMAKFSMEEVNCLQVGGNEKARQIYFKTWNPQRNFFPDNSNIQKLRDFIKYVYVDRRYTGENHPVLLPRLRNSDKDEYHERGRQEIFQERSIDRHSRYADEVRSPGYPRETYDKHSKFAIDEVRSPGYPGETIDRHNRYVIDEGRSPGYNRYSNNEGRSPRRYLKDKSRYDGLRASSSRFEGANARYQVDDARIAGRSATQMFTTEDIKPRRTSPDRHRSRDVNSPPPLARNKRDFLGEKFVASLRAAKNAHVGDSRGQNSPRSTGDQSKSAHRRTVSAHAQKTVESGNQIPASNEPMKIKSGSEGSLIDFASFPPPPPPEASTQNQALPTQIPSNGINSTTSTPPVKVPPKNTLEFLLFELSTPAQITTDNQSGAPADQNAAPTTPSSNLSTLPHVSAQFNHTNEPSNLQLALTSAEEFPNTPSPSAASTANRFITKSISMPQSRHVENSYVPSPQTVPDFLGDDDFASFEETSKQLVPSNHPQENPAVPQTSHLHEDSNNQTTNLFPASRAEISFDVSSAQSSKPSEVQVQETKTAVGIQPSPGDTRFSGRPELPEDLFASLYPSRSIPAPGWQMNPGYGVGFNMQYYQNTPMQTPAFSNVAKSVNPFDTNDDAPQHQFTTISPMPELQGGLPNLPAPTMSRTQSFESHLQGFPSAEPPSYQSGAYLGQYPISNIPPSSQQEMGGFGSGGGATLGSLHLNQLPYQYPSPADPRLFPTGGGNPFG